MGINRWWALGVAVAAVTVTDCSDDELASSVGAMRLELCDRGNACGCERLGFDDGVIDFGAPPANTGTIRVMTITNENQPRLLRVDSIQLTGDTTGAFSIVQVNERSSAESNATVTAHDMAADGALELEDKEEGEVLLSFTPPADGEYTATLTIRSNSATRPTWELTLRGGSGNSTVAAGIDDCGDGCNVDFGTFNDGDVGYDAAAGLPIALGTDSITITNTGDADLFIAVELTDDGIPETKPGELPGDNGVFFLQDVGCAVLGPDETLEIGVEYRPSTAGEHTGEVTIGGLGGPVRVDLFGRVVGAHICFTTEDEIPTDSTLRFGEPPLYTVPQNEPETRLVTVYNCGFQADLEITDLVFSPNTSSEFDSTSIAWSNPGPIAVGAPGIDIPVAYTPDGGAALGSSSSGGLQFSSNDSLRPTAIVQLTARIGAPAQCVLVASPNPVDFGWVAADEAGQGTTCPPAPFPCTGGGSLEIISRFKDVTLINAGRRDCTNITLGEITADSASTGMFLVDDNPNGSSFTLCASGTTDCVPGATDTSDPIRLLFAREEAETASNHFGKLPYQSPDMPIAPIDINLKAIGGGNPNCDISFQPVSPANNFCPNPQLAFGGVPIGTERTIDLKVINTGSDGCKITSINRMSGTSNVFSWTTPTLPVTLPVGDYFTMPVTFIPVPPSGNPFEEMPFGCAFGGGAFPGFPGAGDPQGIRFNYENVTDAVADSKDLDLTGQGKRPDIDVIPGEIDFGEVTVGCCSAMRDVRIYNSGEATLTITEVKILESSDPGFGKTDPTVTEIAPGEDTGFQARFCATAVGEHTGIIHVQSNVEVEYFTIPVTGTGTLDSEATDEFTQPDRPKVDVLWSVDDSGSMGDEQQSLANNFDQFIDTAADLNTDYHIGVILTDSETDWAGKLYSCSGPKWVSDTQPRAEQVSQFRCNVKVSDSGRPNSDSKESPLQAARLALDYPNIDDYNAGFYREDAKLYVILVTDEEDQSDGSAQLYVDYFQNLKGLGNPDLLNISAIAGPPPDGCSTAGACEKGKEAVDLVGGQFKSICSADWSDMIANLGLDVFNARRQFPLSRPATAATLVVTVDGVPVDEDPVDGWTFDAELNAITFNGSSIPGPSAAISVSYTAFCYQP